MIFNFWLLFFWRKKVAFFLFVYYNNKTIENIFANVAELADALDSGSSVLPRAGSSPVIRTTLSLN